MNMAKAAAKKAKKKDEELKKKKGKRAEEPEEEDEEDEAPKKKKKKGKIKEVVNDQAPVVAYGKGLSAPLKIPGFDVDNELDAIERKLGVGSLGLGGDNEGRMSTGMLVYDLILGGGIVPGWYTNFGKEQSCKSTSTMTFTASAVNEGVPIIAVYDYEGSTEPTYLQNLMNTMGVKADITDIFGIKDSKGNYIKKPRVRYVPSSTGEEFFDYLQSLELRLPDKIYSNGSWWYVYQNTNENRKRLKDGGTEYDAKMFTKHNKFYVPAENGALQALLIVDSYPGMVPEKLAENVDQGAGLGAVARMFSENIPKVKGRMRKKRIAVIGVNQLREKPMAMGNPEYEPGGQAVRFFSDARMKHMARACSAVPGAKQADKSPHELEDSVEFDGGKDTYRYISVKAEKNKLSQPYLGGFIRLWIQDGEGNARGFDPVFDTFSYLKATGQLEEGTYHRKAFTLRLVGNEAEKKMDWPEFKKMILGSKEEVSKICKRIGMKPCFIRKQCFKQMKSKKGVDMYFANLNKKKSKDGPKAEEDASDE
jgi:RecA/RadA recombinase